MVKFEVISADEPSGSKAYAAFIKTVEINRKKTDRANSLNGYIKLPIDFLLVITAEAKTLKRIISAIAQQ
jgi:hypothetical protein